MRAGVLAIVGLLSASPAPALAQAPACAKADFEAVVDEAAGALRDLSREHTPNFQAKLRQLKQKRG
jgi:hypothetical protein